MKKILFLFSAAFLFVVFSCNDHKSPDVSGSHTTMDETGPAREKQDTGTASSNVNQNNGTTNDSTGTSENR